MKRWTRGCLLSTLALSGLWACESDLQKLERLELNAATARLEIISHERRRERLADMPDSVETLGAVEDSLYQWRLRRDLAERELNLFMNGR